MGVDGAGRGRGRKGGGEAGGNRGGYFLVKCLQKKKRLADEDFVRNEVFSVDMKSDLEFESTFLEDLINCRRSIQADRRDASVRITPFYFNF